MKSKKRFRKTFRRFVMVFKRHINHFCFSPEQFLTSERQSSVADIFANRKTGDHIKYFLEVIF